MMGVCDGPRAVPGAQLIPGWRPADDDSRHPTAEQLQQAREAEHYAKIKKEILNSIRMLVAQYELTIPARKEALLTLAWSNVWFLVKYDPPDEDDDWLRLLTEVSSFKRSISEPTMSAHPHDGGLAFPLPAHNVRAILCTLMLELMEPYGANQPDPTGAAWNAIPLTLMLRAADAPLDHSVGLLYETDWVYLTDNMQQHDAPTNWIRTCLAWQLIQPYISFAASSAPCPRLCSSICMLNWA